LVLRVEESEERAIRRYVEAFPRLMAHSVVKNWGQGRPVCLWRDQNGAVVGRAIIDSVSTTLFVADCMINLGRHYDGMEELVNLHVDYTGVTGTRQRPLFVCPLCKEMVGQFIFMSQLWCCSKCCNLKNRSALIGTRARRGERLKALEALVGYGRPKHMQTRRYEALRAEMAELQRLVGEHPMVAHSAYADLITAEWHRQLDLAPMVPW
jgi:hypothetical protein